MNYKWNWRDQALELHEATTASQERTLTWVGTYGCYVRRFCIPKYSVLCQNCYTVQASFKEKGSEPPVTIDGTLDNVAVARKADLCRGPTQHMCLPCVFHSVPTQHLCFLLVFHRFLRKTNVSYVFTISSNATFVFSICLPYVFIQHNAKLCFLCVFHRFPRNNCVFSCVFHRF